MIIINYRISNIITIFFDFVMKNSANILESLSDCKSSSVAFGFLQSILFAVL